MDRALENCLDQDERSIIEEKYLSPRKIKDLEIMIDYSERCRDIANGLPFHLIKLISFEAEFNHNF
jgi:hypothetical protein